MMRRVPAEVFPAGEYIRDELAARGWSSTDLAGRLGWSPGRLDAVLAGRTRITPAMAGGLGAAFGVDPSTWTALDEAARRGPTG
jgi:HTH-type transcriptional regulator / antitoxin HigA